MYSVAELRWLIDSEFPAMEDEGLDPSVFRARFAELERAGGDGTKLVGKLGALYDRMSREIAAATARADAGDEPSDLASIRTAAPARRAGRPSVPADPEYLDRLRGAWLGRVAGCIVGKPVEGWPREQIRILLESNGEYPLRRPWIPPMKATRRPRGFERWGRFARDRANWNANSCLRGNIRFAERDDDTNYTILGLVLVERHGRGLTTDHVAAAWHEFLPYGQVCTAEHVAYANLIRGIRPPATATFRNPFRQWIGAQIRCDAFGYCANGDPRRAAAWAHADAALSHTRNGIYGEMFFAAAIAAATAGADLDGAIHAGLGEIPEGSRFTAMVAWMRELRVAEPDWERAVDRIAGKYGHLHSVHTINNAALVLMGLMWGGKRFHATVARTVLGGWDTDCNGATAGSLFGALYGESSIPAGYVRPLHDNLHSGLAGMAEGSILGYAARSLRAARAAATSAKRR